MRCWETEICDNTETGPTDPPVRDPEAGFIYFISSLDVVFFLHLYSSPFRAGDAHAPLLLEMLRRLWVWQQRPHVVKHRTQFTQALKYIIY